MFTMSTHFLFMSWPMLASGPPNTLLEWPSVLLEALADNTDSKSSPSLPLLHISHVQSLHMVQTKQLLVNTLNHAVFISFRQVYTGSKQLWERSMSQMLFLPWL